MIQLYARVSDLIPTEPPIIDKELFMERFGKDNDYAWKAAGEEAGCPNLNAAEYYPQFLKDIELNGVINHPIMVHKNGIVADGNFRVPWHRWAGMGFIPIDLGYFLINDVVKWRTSHPFVGIGAAGKSKTIINVVRHLVPGYDYWWQQKGHEVLNSYIKWGRLTPEFNLSYEECRARLET